METEGEKLFVGGRRRERHLDYADRFKTVIHENPGAIASYLRIHDEMLRRLEMGELRYGDELADGEVKVNVINVKGKESHKLALNRMRTYERAKIGDDNFFVKSKAAFHGMGLGAEEFESCQKAKEVVKDMHDVEIIEYELGYQDSMKRTFFVSRWLDFPRLDIYFREKFERNIITGPSIWRKKEETEDAILENRYNEVVRIMAYKGFDDCYSHNMLYDPIEKKFYLFDIHKD